VLAKADALANTLSLPGGGGNCSMVLGRIAEPLYPDDSKLQCFTAGFAG